MIVDPELEMFKKLLADLVVRYRKKVKLSQEKLAFEVNCSTNNIQDIEAARYCPTAFKMMKLIIVLGIPMHEIEGLVVKLTRKELENV